ncbi:MAG: PilZ domain-containing protein [Candidatus Eremiobacteraeota bacterium]|nr:PilZ domain-containing protein [Candidatus Eremiobacteraeota bacterium]
MYYKEIPPVLLEKLQKPLESVTEEAVKKRLDSLFKGAWNNENTHTQLFAMTIPLINPRGMEIQTTISLWLVKNTITITPPREESLSRSSYLIYPLFDEETKAENERLAFLNTALRGLAIGSDDGRLRTYSLEKDVIARRIFLSERVNDHIFDTEAIKVILSRADEESSERRTAPRKMLPLLQSIPAVVTMERKVTDIELFILDFSSSGLKIVSSFDFPQNRPFTLTLRLAEPVSLWCEVVWKSSLWEQFHHVGIKFVKLHLDKFEKLCRYVEEHLPRRDEGEFKISRMLPVEFSLWEHHKRLPTFFYSLSPKEMSIICPSFLDEGTSATCRIFPFWNLPPIEGEVEVISSKVLNEGGCQAALNFIRLSGENRERIESFLQKCAIEDRHNKKM